MNGPRKNIRFNPRVTDWGYLTLSPLKKAVDEFSQKYIGMEKHVQLLDIGCGDSPYRKCFQGTMIVGVDMVRSEGVTVIADVVELPLKDECIDGVLCTETLEHVFEVNKSVKEIGRVLRHKGLVFVSVPFVFPEHGMPGDYWRFTESALRGLFSGFTILEMGRIGGIVSTLCQTINGWIQNIPLLRDIGPVFFLFFNVTGQIFDWGAKQAGRLFGKRWFVQYYWALPIGRYLVVRKDK